ncbi:heavy metal sensor histidine kinase [Pararobbsia silviterrae]|uniref:Sensor protein n=1 Tax=Pararobbsia silviterrae TaxID=1792498 RepID=A0A494X0F0_9BURK|nr:heavy metal sensor histidine kinase [Pararobbsia silviterrae]RKP43772.1 HAMP domain-containing protein [Pararobbsia silviterrae]
MRLFRSLSLTARTTWLVSLSALVIMSLLGCYLYQSARAAVENHAVTQAAGRAEHYRHLIDDAYTVAQLEQRPMLFETMLGAEQDVLLFRRPGEAPFIHVNPAGIPVPKTLVAVPVGEGLTRADVMHDVLPDGTPVIWAAATAKTNQGGDVVEVIAGHPMYHEQQMLDTYRARIFLAIGAAVVMSTVLGYLLVRSGLSPVREIAARASDITPKNLAVRLSVETAPLELRLLTQSFNAMLDRLADGYQRLQQFSADLAHEIRTPIGALIGTTQVTLGKTRDVDEYQAVLESNLEELNRLKNIAENILFLAHADHATLAVERVEIPIADELGRIADYFEGPADERGLRFEVDASGVMWAQPMMCRRAINNLVVNAVRYAREDTVIRLAGSQDAEGATVVVENDADAIAPEYLARLFDRFYRGDAARSQFTESNGLGLAIVRAIMGLHGGTAKVSCPRADRIRFELRFPGGPAASTVGETASHVVTERAAAVQSAGTAPV